MRSITFLLLTFAATPVAGLTLQERVNVGQGLALPHARNLVSRSRPENAGDVIQVIDRSGEYYLDAGDGNLRQIPIDSLASTLNQLYRDPARDRVLYFGADLNTEYVVIEEVIDIARGSGVTVLATLVEQEGGRFPRLRPTMDVWLGFEQPESMAVGNQIVLQLLTDGSYAINRDPVRLAQLDSAIHSIFDRRPQKLMFVNAAGNRRYQDVITAMDIVRGAGVQVTSIASIEVPQGLPPIDLYRLFDPYDYKGVAASVDLAKVFADAGVDELPRRLSCPVPQYPPMLKQAGVEGSVTLTFVVETDGRTKLETIEVLESTHSAFEGPAKDMITRCLFRPGRIRATAVRVLVRMPVVFGDKAYVAAMKSDLRLLLYVQESYFADNMKYAAEFSTAEFVASRGVQIVINKAQDDGWSGTARHSLTSMVCHIFIGVEPPVPGMQAFEPYCEEDRGPVAAMRGDLLNLATAEEGYFADNVAYTDDLAKLSYFEATTGVQIAITLIRYGWSATARHDETPVACHFFVGADPPFEGVNEGEVFCKEP